MAILPELQLSIYNDALRLLGERRLASLSEAREPRRVLDDAWGDGSAVLWALAKGDWNFALRSVAIGYDPDRAPLFGWRRAFAQPGDLVRLSSLAADERMTLPLTSRGYADENGLWLSDHDTLYVRYVSSDGAFGFDGSLWPETFRRLLAASLAHECCERITNSGAKVERAERAMGEALADARSADAMRDGAKFPPPGSWVRARGAGLAGRDPWRAR